MVATAAFRVIGRSAAQPEAAAKATGSARYTLDVVAKGTLWNAALAATGDRQQFLSGRVLGKSWAAHMASGNGVHNPFLLEALLTSSIAALHTTYSLTPPANMDLQIRATPPPGLKVSVR